MNNFWENRYRMGGNSGAGSYGEFAEHKANVINNYILKYNIKTISDFGCGDGNQISFINGFENYVGYDISPYALNLCSEKFKNNRLIKFCSSILDLPEADLCMSLDVIYHIIDKNEYEKYMSLLFEKSKKFVLIFSSNYDENYNGGHIYNRKFSDWINKNQINFVLVEEINNLLQTTAKFYLYERI